MSLPRISRICLAVSSILAMSFAGWALLALRDGGRLADFDRATALALKEAAAGHQFRRHLMVAFTLVGSAPAMALLALVGAAWQWRRRDKTLAVAWVVIVVSGGLLTLTLKKAIDRPRPPAAWRDEAVYENNESFPSGHAMGSMIGYGMLAYVALRSLRNRAAKIAVLAALAGVVGLIGFSRIYLRGHWYSDLIGGILVGAAWLTFGLAWVEYVRARRRSNTPGAKPRSEP